MKEYKYIVKGAGYTVKVNEGEGNMAKVNVDANAVKCQLEGAVEVFEIVPNK